MLLITDRINHDNESFFHYTIGNDCNEYSNKKYENKTGEYTMYIEHIALWVKDLEAARDFYCDYFGAVSNDVYRNPTKGFKSYFLTFEKGARLELMSRTDVTEAHEPAMLGWAHLAISVGSQEKVDQLTEQLIQDGYTCQGKPRTTGDGYYESVVEDPEGNWIEITV